jgi:UDP-2-acetamido-3-amino-2,3-dideoxy-glucuronate N-acetyltransferase
MKTSEWLNLRKGDLHEHAQIGFNFWTIYPTVDFGKRVKLGACVVIEDGCIIGDDVLIGNCVTLRPKTTIKNGVVIGHNTVIEGWSVIGERTRIQANSFICKGAIIQEDVFIGPGFVCGEDRNICSHGRSGYKKEPIRICRKARIGMNVCVLPGVSIGCNAFVAAGSLVTKKVLAYEKAAGRPAVMIGIVPSKERI